MAPAGSAILWDSALRHTSRANRGEAPRYSLVFYFQRRWVRTCYSSGIGKVSVPSLELLSTLTTYK